jgi:broad-specificity NMP kinase
LTLIVVSGAPGTGKSTIARALGADLRFPVLSLDPEGSEFCVLSPRGNPR